MLTKSQTILFMLATLLLTALFIFYDYTSRNNEIDKDTEIEESVFEETNIEQIEETNETTFQTVQSESKPTIESNKETEAIVDETTCETYEDTNVDKLDDNLINLGEFRLTAYCNCKKCCGKWAGGATASGTMPSANRTIAVDTDIIAFGTKVIINGNTYIAEDTGSAIYGNRIDIYFDTHKEAVNFGVQYAEVFVVSN